MVYHHLWQTFGQSRKVRLSFCMQFVARIIKLIALPIALSLIVSGLARSDFEAGRDGVLLFVTFSLTLGILTPLAKYIGMLGEAPVYRINTGIYFSKLVSADLDYFNSNLSGYLTSATRQYIDSALQLVRALRDQYMNSILSILFPVVVIAYFDPILGLATAVLSLGQTLYIIWASQMIAKYRTKSREVYKRNSGRMADAISNILAIKASSQETAHIQHIEQGAADENIVFKKRYTVQAQLTGLREAIAVAFFAVLLWLTVERMSSGAITITTAVLVATYTATILTAIYALSEDLDSHDDFVDKIIPAFDILDRHNTIQDPVNPHSFDSVRGSIEFDRVSFRYDRQSQQPALHNFSLTIPHGQKVGVVGLSGAGKSTLTKLLLRFNDVSHGTIRIDNIDIREITQTDLRKNISYVPQEPLLMHTSVRENVLLARPDATKEQVIQALKSAHAFDFVMSLPDGLDSIVGERGVKLSGGQKQRIAIVRAVLQHAPIMVLDEATSALDSESEQIIKDSFSEILADKTAIVVAHRLSTLSDMDRIIVLDGGHLVEDGSHQELLALNGVYARLWKHQQKHIEKATK